MGETRGVGGGGGGRPGGDQSRSQCRLTAHQPPVRGGLPLHRPGPHRSNLPGINSHVESCVESRDADPMSEPGRQKGAGSTHGAWPIGEGGGQGLSEPQPGSPNFLHAQRREGTGHHGLTCVRRRPSPTRTAVCRVTDGPRPQRLPATSWEEVSGPPRRAQAGRQGLSGGQRALRTAPVSHGDHIHQLRFTKAAPPFTNPGIQSAWVPAGDKTKGAQRKALRPVLDTRQSPHGPADLGVPKVQPGPLRTVLCRDAPGPHRGPQPALQPPPPLLTSDGPLHTADRRRPAPAANTDTLLPRLGTQAPQGSRLHPGGAESRSHCLGPASLPPSPGAGSAGPGIPEDAAQLGAQSGPGTRSGNTDHRPQTVPRREAPHTPEGVQGSARTRTDAAGCPTACGWHGQGASANKRGLQHHHRGGVQPLHPGSHGHVGCLQGCGVPPRAEASAVLVLSREEKGQQERRRLARPPPRALDCSPRQGRAARGSGRTLPGGP
ncbi:unnamed protein product [Rangifer tarandus platyrhynchus]|uniref:Uncharacterized protein n=1 Tax=Rangifer tarandus platyrhynchus TaxID=3082113 RepID=A0ABN8ZMB7_RANTA|nr:unnamed protein product [Rangifer tarandus platyrhynchus]